MNVNINETRRQQTVMQFKNAKTLAGKIGTDGNNTAAGNSDVQPPETRVRKHPSASQQQFHPRPSPYFLICYDIVFRAECQFPFCREAGEKFGRRLGEKHKSS